MCTSLAAGTCYGRVTSGAALGQEGPRRENAHRSIGSVMAGSEGGWVGEELPPPKNSMSDPTKGRPATSDRFNAEPLRASMGGTSDATPVPLSASIMTPRIETSETLPKPSDALTNWSLADTQWIPAALMRTKRDSHDGAGITVRNCGVKSEKK
jgi:hypothetical protein